MLVEADADARGVLVDVGDVVVLAEADAEA